MNNTLTARVESFFGANPVYIMFEEFSGINSILDHKTFENFHVWLSKILMACFFNLGYMSKRQMEEHMSQLNFFCFQVPRSRNPRLLVLISTNLVKYFLSKKQISNFHPSFWIMVLTCFDSLPPQPRQK